MGFDRCHKIIPFFQQGRFIVHEILMRAQIRVKLKKFANLRLIYRVVDTTNPKLQFLNAI